MIAGIDYSTRAVDVVLLDEDSDAATWHRFELHARGARDDAFERTRSVGDVVPGRHSAFWDDVLSVGLELPFGPNKNTLQPMLGAILTCIPANRQVEPFHPSRWRKTVGLPGNASKADIMEFVDPRLLSSRSAYIGDTRWPQDACDAYCIALATRTLIERVAA